MESFDYLVVGAGVTGLSSANWILREAKARNLPPPSLLVIEADDQPGGYCKTVKQDGFVWDYSGHLFHFRHAELEAWLRERMPDQEIRTVEKNSLVRYRGRDIDFPFQKNIHQLPRADFIDCLVDLFFREEAYGTGDPTSFQEMLFQRFGKSIAKSFLVPYNEKLYACHLDALDVNAMGRFFPHAELPDIIRNMRIADNRSYNSTFSYPLGGAIEYINALLYDLPGGVISYGERLESVVLEDQVACTSKREVHFNHLISSAPFNQLIAMCDIDHVNDVFSWNKVLVLNLGFDRKGAEGVHWMYFPESHTRFYRVGWYDNIMGSDRMSLYAEIGAASDGFLDIEAERERVLADLRRENIVGEHKLESWHSVVLDPAYVHITAQSMAEFERLAPILRGAQVYSVGRYGRWTHCSIEDNIVETRELATKLAGD
jgi:protoporphyrinogen oxidase